MQNISFELKLFKFQAGVLTPAGVQPQLIFAINYWRHLFSRKLLKKFKFFNLLRDEQRKCDFQPQNIPIFGEMEDTFILGKGLVSLLAIVFCRYIRNKRGLETTWRPFFGPEEKTWCSRRANSTEQPITTLTS